MALKSLKSLKKRLLKDPILHQRYTEQMESNVQKGYAELISVDDQFCGSEEWCSIPHHPVLSSKRPDKVRISYDCVASAEGKSLNDFLLKGPDLMNFLVEVLLRFRKDKLPIVANLEAMFHQIRVLPSNRNALRFFWWP